MTQTAPSSPSFVVSGHDGTGTRRAVQFEAASAQAAEASFLKAHPGFVITRVDAHALNARI